MPPQHENCQYETTTSIMAAAAVAAATISPSPMTSEFKGAMNDTTNSQTCQDLLSPSWQKDRLFLEDLTDVLACIKLKEITYDRRRIRKQQERHRKTPGTTNNCESEICDLPPFHDAWRPVMISWMYHVADTFRLMPIVVSTGIHILDNCAWDLCNPSSRTYNQKELYPLMTMTALNMAVKCHETKMFPLEQLVQLLGTGGGSSADRSYTPDDICAMERRLLHRCGWKFHCPTTHDYLLRFVTVIAEEHRASVMSFAVTHLKRSLLWEHILHEETKEGDYFSTCTLAYAAFLLAMEDAGLPLEHKQAACLVLLDVANLSAQTPRLSEAYNWLSKANKLQAQLEQGKTLPVASATTTSDNAVPAHASPEPLQEESSMDMLDDSCSDQMSCDTRQSNPVASSSEVPIVEPDYDDENGAADDHSTSIMSHGSSVDSVIFCSYNSSDGDSVEVVASNNVYIEEEYDDDDESMDYSTTVATLPTVAEEEEQDDAAIDDDDDDCEEEQDDDDEESVQLVLTESLDEDGFEVAFEDKNTNLLVSLMASPRDVSVAL